jgi:hypothetical protein
MPAHVEVYLYPRAVVAQVPPLLETHPCASDKHGQSYEELEAPVGSKRNYRLLLVSTKTHKGHHSSAVCSRHTSRRRRRGVGRGAKGQGYVDKKWGRALVDTGTFGRQRARGWTCGRCRYVSGRRVHKVGRCIFWISPHARTHERLLAMMCYTR